MKKWENPSISELNINETSCDWWDWFLPCIPQPSKPNKPHKPHKPGKDPKPNKPGCGDDDTIGGDDYTELFS